MSSHRHYYSKVSFTKKSRKRNRLTIKVFLYDLTTLHEREKKTTLWIPIIMDILY